jgi:hypothetical protein
LPVQLCTAALQNAFNIIRGPVDLYNKYIPSLMGDPMVLMFMLAKPLQQKRLLAPGTF